MRHLIATFLVALLALTAAPAIAQSVNYDTWNQVAERAESLTANPQATNEELARTRARIVDWRDRLQEGQNANGDRIATLRNQIEALGPAPAEGATEDEEVANRRTELNQQLSTAQAPRIAATEATSRANSIIGQIDEIVRQRQALELAKQTPSPVLPASWAAAATDGLALLEGVGGEVSGQDATPEIWADLRPRLPYVAGYLIAALLILTYGRAWIVALPTRLSSRASEYSKAVLAFVVSLGQIAVPMAGVYLGISAIQATGLPGPWTTPFLNALPVAAVILFGGIWMARALFPRTAIAYTSLQMTEEARVSAGRMVQTLALLMAIHHILSRAMLPLSGLYEQGEAQVGRVPVQFGEASAGVWHLVLIVLAALAMFRLGNILRRLTRDAVTQDLSYRHWIAAWAGRLTRIIAPIAVLLTAAGFVNLGNLLVWPWLFSLALVGLLILLQDFTADLFNMMQRGAEGAREGLAPLLTGFGLVLASIPIFLIIWGSSGAELAEYWVRFRQGISLGGVNLSPGAILTFLIIFAIGYALTRGVQGMLRTSILPKTRLDAGGQNAVVSGLGYVGIFLAALLAITSAGIDMSSFAIVAGALSVGIGFGLQNIVSNFVSGIILLIERPVSVGDWISAGGQQGIVKKISVRATLGRDLRQDRGDRPEQRPDQPAGDQLDASQQGRPDHHPRRRCLWQRHEEGRECPARDRRGSPVGLHRPGTGDPVPGPWGRCPELRDPGDPGGCRHGAWRDVGPAALHRPALWRRGDRDPLRTTRHLAAQPRGAARSVARARVAKRAAGCPDGTHDRQPRTDPR